jgi:hypothetical protein
MPLYGCDGGQDWPKTWQPFETAGYVAENAALSAVAVRHPGIRLEWDRLWDGSVTRPPECHALTS